MGLLREQPEGALLSTNSQRAQTIAGGDPKLGTDGRDHRAILRGQGSGSEMRTLRRFLKRLTWWATRQQDEERLQAEIEEHLALQAAENLRAGLSPVEARRQAVLKF